MAKQINELLVAQGGVRIPASAGAGKFAVSDSSGNIAWRTIGTADLPSVAFASSRVRLLELFGHSIPRGQGSSLTGIPSLAPLGYAAKLGALLGATVRGQGVNSSILTLEEGVGTTGGGGFLAHNLQRGLTGSGNYNGYYPNTAPFEPRSELAVLHWGVNDIVAGGSLRAGVQQAFAAACARVRSSVVIEQDDLTFTGTWATITSGSSSGARGGTSSAFKRSSTNGDSVSVSLPAGHNGECYLFMLAKSTDGGIVTATIGGTTVGSVDTRGQGSSTDNNTQVLVLTGIAPGAQTIIFTLSSVQGNGVGIDAFGICANPTPLILLPQQYYLDASQNRSNAQVDALNTAIAAAAAQFPDGNVIAVNLHALDTPATGLMNADLLHPNDAGHALIAQLLYQAIPAGSIPSLSHLKQAAEPWHQVGFVNEPGLLNSWGSFGFSHTYPGFRLLRDGRVALKGAVGAGTLGSAIFTLPYGYRPNSIVVKSGVNYNGSAWLDGIPIEIDTSGNVIPLNPSGSSNNLVHFDLEFDMSNNF